MQKIRQMVRDKQDEGSKYINEVLDLLEEVYFFEGYLEFFTSLVPREGPIVLGHNDTQENNFLVSNKSNEKMLLIDYEYSDWNPIAQDLANYINECICDNNA